MYAYVIVNSISVWQKKKKKITPTLVCLVTSRFNFQWALSNTTVTTFLYFSSWLITAITSTTSVQFNSNYNLDYNLNYVRLQLVHLPRSF